MRSAQTALCKFEVPVLDNKLILPCFGGRPLGVVVSVYRMLQPNGHQKLYLLSSGQVCVGDWDGPLVHHAEDRWRKEPNGEYMDMRLSSMYSSRLPQMTSMPSSCGDVLYRFVKVPGVCPDCWERLHPTRRPSKYCVLTPVQFCTT